MVHLYLSETADDYLQATDLLKPPGRELCVASGGIVCFCESKLHPKEKVFMPEKIAGYILRPPPRYAGQCTVPKPSGG